MRTVPPEWSIVALGEVADTQLGKMLDSARQTEGREVTYLRNVNVRWGTFDLTDLKTLRLDESDIRKFSVQQGDLVLCEGGEPGRCATWTSPEPMVFQKSLHRIRAGAAIDVGFLRYVMEWLAATRRLDEHFTGVTIAHLPQERLRRLEIPLPPLEEQRRIVALLDDYLSRQEHAEAAIARAHALAASAWTSFLSWALDEAAEVGTSRPFGDVATTRLGKMLDAKRNTGVSTPYLRNHNVQWRSIDFVDVLEVPLSASEVADLVVASGDLLVCEGGEPGRCAVVEAAPARPVAFQKALHRVRANDGVSVHYLQLVIEALARRGALEPLLTGTTIKHLPQERLRALEVPMPNRDVQRALVDRATTMRAYLDALLEDLHRVESQSQALRRSLFSAAFAGQLLKESSLV